MVRTGERAMDEVIKAHKVLLKLAAERGFTFTHRGSGVQPGPTSLSLAGSDQLGYEQPTEI